MRNSAGSHSSSFSGHARLIYFNLLGGLITLDVITNTLGLTGCGGLLGLGIPGVQTAPVSFTVTANVVKNCIAFAANDLDFGSVSALAGNRDAQTSMQVTCTRDAPWSIALDNGQNYSGGSRRMRLGSGYVGYQLFRDAARAQAWSTGVGNVATGTGSGAGQSLTVYGRVPPQVSPGPGTYTDTVVATITF